VKEVWFDKLKSFIKDGRYNTLKRTEQDIKKMKENIREYQEKLNIRRIEWFHAGVVGKFISVNKYSYDRVGLNEFLYDIGILPLIVSFDERQLPDNILEAIKVVQVPERNTIRYLPNNLAKSKMDIQINVENYCITDLVTLWKKSRNVSEVLSCEWERLKNKVLSTLNNDNLVKIEDEFGNFYIDKAKKEYEPNGLLQMLGAKGLIEFGKPDMSKLGRYTSCGIPCIKDINQFRTIIDVSLKYMLIESEKEEKMREYLYRTNLSR
jgi:hypothetical protein